MQETAQQWRDPNITQTLFLIVQLPTSHQDVPVMDDSMRPQSPQNSISPHLPHHQCLVWHLQLRVIQNSFGSQLDHTNVTKSPTPDLTRYDVYNGKGTLILVPLNTERHCSKLFSPHNTWRQPNHPHAMLCDFKNFELEQPSQAKFTFTFFKIVLHLFI